MAKEKDKNRKSKDKKIKASKLTVNFLFGDLISSAFFNRNKFTILITVVMLMLYITIKYKCKTRMETINRLQSELAIVKSESIHEQSLYMSNTRESTMQARVDTMHLGLKVQQHPPFILKYKDHAK